MTMKRAIFGAFASLLLLSSVGTAGPILDRIKSTGVIKVSTAGTWPPQSFINDKNELDDILGIGRHGAGVDDGESVDSDSVDTGATVS